MMCLLDPATLISHGIVEVPHGQSVDVYKGLLRGEPFVPPPPPPRVLHYIDDVENPDREPDSCCLTPSFATRSARNERLQSV